MIKLIEIRIRTRSIFFYDINHLVLLENLKLAESATRVHFGNTHKFRI